MKIKIWITILVVLLFSAPTICNAATDATQTSKPASTSKVEGAHKPFHGNFKTMKYHNSECDHYDCKTCTKIFKTKKAAEKAGYTPCGICGG